ncbi:MAG: MaoC family dehydratase [Acidimicrobiales bacterium]|nr:MaoC family dehydratase [Acidimicrobiales bacterium]MCB1260271.1 MaoC family dehydratase [Acidimicrobiales bacterium]
MSNVDAAFEVFQAALGQEEGVGEWLEITQEMVNQFADVTFDHQFIHVDPEAAKATPFGGTIAHGFLTLSLLTHLSGSIRVDPGRFQGVIMGVNYGFDKVRFISPVKVGSRIRARSTLSDVQRKGPSGILSTRTMTVEIDGEDKPACIADWLTLIQYG